MKKYILVIILIASLGEVAISQIQAVQIISPRQNQEICSSTSIPLSASFKNSDISSHTLLAQFTIRNIVTGFGVYSASDTLYNVPPGGVIDTSFPAYVVDPNKLNQLGTFFACAKVTAFDSLDRPIKDWSFADTICVRIFDIQTMSLPFIEPSDNYSKTVTGDIPNQIEWVSIGAKIYDGESATWDPPPPRYDDSSKGVGPDEFKDPVIGLDRFDENRIPYSGNGVGDTLISFPFNLKGQTRVVLSFDLMRSGSNQYPDMWDSVKMIGAEQTVLDKNGNVIRTGDSLIIEFKDPAEPTCNPEKWNEIVAIDGGIDMEFKNIWLKISVGTVTFRMSGMQQITIPIGTGYFDTAFRFRLRLKANNDADLSLRTNDDNDSWYLDNVTLGVPRLPEVEVMWARVVSPYTKIPFSATSAMPVYFSVKNIYTDIAIAFPMKVWITDDSGKTVYSKNINVNSLRGGADSVIRMPDWNAQPWITGAWDQFFRVHAALAISNYDDYTQNNETFSVFYPTWDITPSAIQEFALDDGGTNDIPSITRIVAAGAGFSGTSGSYAMKFTLPQSDTIYGGRIYFTPANSSPDGIRISLYHDDSSNCVPGEIVKRQDGSEVVLEDVRKGGLFNQFWPYYFPQPVAVPAGSYWLSISQLGLNSMMVGGDLSRGSGIIKTADPISPIITPVYSDPYGTQISPGLNTGDISCSYALEVPATSGQWQKWMPESGYWPTNTSGSGRQSTSWDPNLFPPYNRGGSFLPMIRVMVGGISILSEVMHDYLSGFGFEEIYPNPFTPSSGSALLNFTLSEDGFVSLIIYNEMSTEIRKIAANKMEKGSHTERWDGKDVNGNFVTPGIYFCRITESGRTASIKISVIE